MGNVRKATEVVEPMAMEPIALGPMAMRHKASTHQRLQTQWWIQAILTRRKCHLDSSMGGLSRRRRSCSQVSIQMICKKWQIYSLESARIESTWPAARMPSWKSQYISLRERSQSRTTSWRRSSMATYGRSWTVSVSSLARSSLRLRSRLKSWSPNSSSLMYALKRRSNHSHLRNKGLITVAKIQISKPRKWTTSSRSSLIWGTWSVPVSLPCHSSKGTWQQNWVIWQK